MRLHELVLAGCIVLSGCMVQRPQQYSPHATLLVAPGVDQEYSFGVEPMRPVTRMVERYLPLVEYLNNGSSEFDLKLESALTYERYENKLKGGNLDFAILEPHQVLEAETFGYRVFARAGSEDRISGVILVRRDGHVRSMGDLRGKRICFGSPDELAATMLPRMRLLAGGLRPANAAFAFAGSGESAIVELLSGTAGAAAASRQTWETFARNHPEAAAQIEVKWRTADLPGPAVMAHSRVPAAHVQQITRTLTELERTEAGREVLGATGFSGFRRAESGSYDEVWEFMGSYKRAHRRLEKAVGES